MWDPSWIIKEETRGRKRGRLLLPTPKKKTTELIHELDPFTL
jgi:hypothetical protein